MTYPEYIGEWGGVSQYSFHNPPDMLVIDSRYPVTICAAKCGRWWRMAQGYLNNGLCWKCWKEQFEGDEEIPL